ncbi:MAG: ATP synthase F1 subunit delta [Anaerolineae bacterium]|nr:ATP synthase F1 subunit delta [Anaerolineae bacterium]
MCCVDFLLLLNHKGRLSRLLSIVTAYKAMVQDRFGVVEVTVFARLPVPSDQMERIREHLQRHLHGREVRVHNQRDEHMVGGIKMQIGDRLYDDSFRTMLRHMRELIREDGSAVIKSRGGEMIDAGAVALRVQRGQPRTR